MSIQPPSVLLQSLGRLGLLVIGDGLGSGQPMAGAFGQGGGGVLEGTEADRPVSIPQDEARVWGSRTRGNKDGGIAPSAGVGSQTNAESSLWQ